MRARNKTIVLLELRMYSCYDALNQCVLRSILVSLPCMRVLYQSWNATLQVFYDYLSLIVNTRCQLSLARAVNCPDRGINHAAFTELKHLAQSRNMPLYQVFL